MRVKSTACYQGSSTDNDAGSFGSGLGNPMFTGGLIITVHAGMRRLALCGGVEWDVTLTILDIRPLLRGRTVLDGQPQTAVCAQAVGAQCARFEAYNLALPKRAVIGNVDEDLRPLAVGKEGPVMFRRR